MEPAPRPACRITTISKVIPFRYGRCSYAQPTCPRLRPGHHRAGPGPGGRGRVESAMNGLSLPSGVVLDRPLDSILAFCREEYAYYDDIASTDPDTVQPLDVLATVSV